ncbi:hypothetical protein BCV69DRAFT_296685 [Microstroma glucosiphilum]|uniref:Peptidase S54 rhomboid domain-containing protein n=1 Tax=Pseudomicrostroma glucosiphilum TaxID=1684307 RepID=A0A316UCY7_9BASI|nr:hypothetical protein BCV69DRAFT_296685 [Pseudomicrostroma glucosiphilum]PWN22704.1 hypothetical protein BCV69DRAFT_296685 [Pseudomicrostroma glucosiphilum]
MVQRECVRTLPPCRPFAFGVSLSQDRRFATSTTLLAQPRNVDSHGPPGVAQTTEIPTGPAQSQESQDPYFTAADEAYVTSLHAQGKGRGNAFTLAGWGIFAFVAVPLAMGVYSRERAKTLAGQSGGRFGWFSNLSPGQRMEDAWRQELADSFGRVYAGVMKVACNLPTGGQEFVSRQWLDFADWAVNLPTYQLTVLPFIALNTAVFIIWWVPIPAVQVFMSRNFATVTGHKRFFTLFTSAFSHRGPMHFILNQVALLSVGSVALDSVSKLFPIEKVKEAKQGGLLADGWKLPEVDSTAKLLTFFLGAAFVSGGCSWAWRRVRFAQVRTAYQQAVQAGAPAPYRLASSFKGAEGSGSLGSSGVVYGLFTLTAIMHPDSKIGIIFLPQDYALDARTAMTGLLSVDLGMLLTSIITGRSFFIDNVAHLAGAAFGVVWYHSAYLIWEYSRLVDPKKLARRVFGGEQSS